MSRRQQDNDAYIAAADDVLAQWVEASRGACKQCSVYMGLNVDGRCQWCAIAFVCKIRSIAVIAEPWALRHCRSLGIANQ